MSLVKCTCIDDKNRPLEIPKEKWVKEGEQYRILGITLHVNQGRIQGCTLIEKPLDESCNPYSAFRLSRFSVNIEDMPALIQLMKDCNDLRDMDDDSIEHILTEEFELQDY